MVKNYSFLAIASVVTGVLTHAVFYPLLEQWHNERMKSFAKFGIGVGMGLPVFGAWYRESLKTFTRHDEVTRDQMVVLAALTYLCSFTVYGAGVVLGYVLGDIFGYPAGWVKR